jgi:putative lipoic acid-binding regulatory protein
MPPKLIAPKYNYHGHIWLLWGEDKEHLQKQEYFGKRTLRALHVYKNYLQEKGKYCCFIQYEDEKGDINFYTTYELKSMGILSDNFNKNDTKETTRYRFSNGKYLGYRIPFRDALKDQVVTIRAYPVDSP